MTIKKRRATSVVRKRKVAPRSLSDVVPSSHGDDKIAKDMESTIRTTMYRLISRTQQSSTICPSQVARTMHADDQRTYKEWRPLMEPVRAVVWDDVKEGLLEVTQKGEVRDWAKRAELKGPIRVRRGPKWDSKDEPDRTDGLGHINDETGVAGEGTRARPMTAGQIRRRERWTKKPRRITSHDT